jgi:hypothetical protein
VSGFISRLAERAVGASRLVEPRLRSRFEPDAPFAVASPMEIEQFVDAPRSDLSRPGAEPRAPLPSPGPRATVDGAAIAARGALGEPTPGAQHEIGDAPRLSTQGYVAGETPTGPPEREVAPVVEPRALERDMRSTRLGDHGARAVAPKPPTDQTVFVERLVAETDPEPDDIVFAAPDNSDSLSRSLSRASVGPEVPADAVEPATPTHVRSPRISRHELRRPGVAPIGRDHDLGREDRTEWTSHADGEPVVHVQIGRIDVRATTPPPPAVLKTALPPVESLDDYLKRTSGRR